MKKICIVIPYFGELPSYFKFWLESVKYNKNIDFLLITNQKLELKVSNLKVINKTFNEQVAEIQAYFNFRINLDKPYKLCDFKPMYGMLYKSELKDYEWWGFCDIDLIFGDLEYFFKKIDFDEFERILGRGHLSLFKNNPDVNSYFMKLNYSGVTYKEAFSSSKNYAFDETNGTTKLFLENGKKVYLEEIIADIEYNQKVMKLTKANKIKNKKKQIFVYENNKVLMYFLESNEIKKQEFLYLHFQKRNLKEIKPFDKIKDFYITPNGFLEKNKCIEKEDIFLYNDSKGSLKYKIDYIKKKITKYF